MFKDNFVIGLTADGLVGQNMEQYQQHIIDMQYMIVQVLDRLKLKFTNNGIYHIEGI